MSHPPVVIVASGGVPKTQVSVASGIKAPARTVATSGAPPITLTSNAPPVILYDEAGDEYVPA